MKLKTLLLIGIFFGLSNDSGAQVEYLRLSPKQKIEQRVGATDMTIEFSRPQMKGRKVFGDLVPYGELWRTGANENTILSFDHRVRIGETEVQAGQYALITKPMEREWAIYFYTDIDNLEVPNPIDSSKLIYLTTVLTKEKLDLEETLIINIYNITETSANLGICWERTEVSIPITFFTKEAMEKMIVKEFEQNILDYSIAASYYEQRGIELEKARELRELAMSLKTNPNAWDYHSYGIILKKLGKKKEALKNIKHSLDLAKDTRNTYLIIENEKQLLELNQ